MTPDNPVEPDKETQRGVWEFTFMAVQEAETETDALESVLLYLAEYASKGELSPVAVKRLE
jgi:hypothetical protein